jgi:CRP-like cAMP-binding protein
MNNNLQEIVAAHPLFKGLSPQHLEVLADCAMKTQFKAGEIIFRRGDTANRFYLIESGKVALTTAVNGAPHEIQIIGAGDVLGWSWLFPPYEWHFEARAIETTDAIFLYGTRLREVCERDHDLGYELIKRMAEILMMRLQATRREMARSSRRGPPVYVEPMKEFAASSCELARV